MKEINHTERSSVVCAVETVTDPKNLKTNPNTHTHKRARAPVCRRKVVLTVNNQKQGQSKACSVL